MSRCHNLKRIRAVHSYTAPELAKTLKVNVLTIRRWCQEGLSPIDRKRPFLFFGEHVIAFLEARRPPRRHLAPGQLLCVRCNAFRSPVGNIIELVERGPTTVDFKGDCEVCGKPMFRRVRKAEIKAKLGPCSIACRDDQTTMVRSSEPDQMSLFEAMPS